MLWSVGLDPARPLIEQHASRDYRLTRDDAEVVQIIHTNAGTLGQLSLSGSLDLCVNGGRLQPFCRRGFQLSESLSIRMRSRSLNRHFPSKDRNRCSHFLSVCYLANAIFKHKLFPFRPCPEGCVSNNLPILPIFGRSTYSYRPNYSSSSLARLMHIGQDVPEE